VRSSGVSAFFLATFLVDPAWVAVCACIDTVHKTSIAATAARSSFVMIPRK
jgi:hypothetical protein